MQESNMDKVKNHMRWLLIVLIIAAALFMSRSQSYALDVTLQWASNPEPGIVKYKVYYRAGFSGNRVLNKYKRFIGAVEGTSPVDVLPAADENPDPDVVEFTLHGLPSFLAYYFVVTASDNKNLESEASNEVATNYSGPGKVDILSASPPPSTWSNDNTVTISWASPSGMPYGVGIAGYSTIWDMSSGTTPAATKTLDAVTSTTSAALLDGNKYYFHIRAADTVGNWGEAVHYGPFYIDTGPPGIDSVRVISGTTVEITYSEYSMENAAISANYSFDNGVIVSGVTDVTGEGRAFRLELSNFQSYIIYTMTINENLKDAAGNLVPATQRKIRDINDSDSDGLADGQEVLLGRDPALKEVVFGSDSAKITNPFLPLSADLKMKYAGIGTMAGYGHYDLVLGTEVVDSVECLKVVERGNGNNRNPDLDPEWYDLWLAQDTSGVVWLLQEYSALEDSYRVLGKADAVVWLPANPVLGQRFAQEGPSYREVVETGVTVAQLSTGLGPYNGCLTVRWTNGSDDTFGHLAPGVGIVKEEWSGGETTNGWELQEITKAVTGSDELVANYGVTYGLWHYDQVRGWTQLNTVNPDQMLAADIDNDGAEELVASFNGYGLYVYKESNGWSQINDVVPDAMMRLGNGLVVNCGATYGLWRYDQVRGWIQLNTENPDQMLAADIDNDGAEELVVSFNGYGLYVYKESNGWSQINSVVPDAMMRLGSGLAVNYGVTYGLWRYDQVRGWTQLDTVNPDQMLATDIDNDGAEELVASFNGHGLRVYKEANGWSQLSTVQPDAMMRLGSGLVVNYGVTYGLWRYDQVRGWTQLDTLNPDQMLAVDMDNDGMEEVVVSFSGYGLYLYKETIGWILLNSVIPEAIIGANLIN